MNSWIKTDNEVGRIIDSLRKAEVLDQTAVFFWTGHGVSNMRGKQFLYDEGIRVPLIMRLTRTPRQSQCITAFKSAARFTIRR